MKLRENEALLEPWRRLVQNQPDAPAVIEAGTEKRWTFGELDRLSIERAQSLERQESRLRGLPVLFSEPNGGEWIARFLALLRLRAPAYPIDVSTPVEGIRETAARCGAAEWTPEGRLIVPKLSRRMKAPAIAVLKSTSGTTGGPRPIPFRAEELAADGRQVMTGMGFGARDRNFGVIPFGHSYGLGNLVAPLLLEGVAIVSGSSPLPRILATEFRAGGANTLPAVPSLFEGLVRSRAELPGLRLAITAGAPLRRELARAWFDGYQQPLHNFFGSSESGGIAYDADGEAGLSGRSVGRPLPGVTVSLTSRGRIRVRSAAVYTRGNKRRSRGMGEGLVSDFGEWNDLGELVLKGRSGAMIKVGARRVDPAEIERALLRVSGVREAWATSWNAAGEERPAAVVASDLTSANLRDLLRLSLAAWKIPRPLVVVQKLPLTERGKPDRAELHRRLKRAEGSGEGER